MATRITTAKGRAQTRQLSYRTGVRKPSSSSMEQKMFGNATKTKQKMASKWNSGCKTCG